MKASADYRVVVHNFENEKFVNEYYKLNIDGTIFSLVTEPDEIDAIFKTENKDVVELYHHKDYEKVVSKELGVLLYGAYINISNRIPDSINRF